MKKQKLGVMDGVYFAVCGYLGLVWPLWSIILLWRMEKWQSSITASQCVLIGTSILIHSVGSHYHHALWLGSGWCVLLLIILFLSNIKLLMS